MYRVLKTSVRTIISSDEVIYAAPTMDKVDVRYINAAIQVAEERFIKTALCKSMYYDFRTQKNVVVDSINKEMLQLKFPDGITLIEGDIVNAIELVSNSWYIELWNEYLWKLTAEAVSYMAIPSNFVRTTAQGEMQNNPKNPLENQGAATADLATVKWKMDKTLMDRIDPLRAPLDQWLFDNRLNFPLIDCKNWDFVEPPSGVSFKRKSAFVFGVYDNLGSSSKCCCDE